MSTSKGKVTRSDTSAIIKGDMTHHSMVFLSQRKGPQIDRNLRVKGHYGTEIRHCFSASETSSNLRIILFQRPSQNESEKCFHFLNQKNNCDITGNLPLSYINNDWCVHTL